MTWDCFSVLSLYQTWVFLMCSELDYVCRKSLCTLDGGSNVVKWKCTNTKVPRGLLELYYTTSRTTSSTHSPKPTRVYYSTIGKVLFARNVHSMSYTHWLDMTLSISSGNFFTALTMWLLKIFIANVTFWFSLWWYLFHHYQNIISW